MKNDKIIALMERKCPVCGKTFIVRYVKDYVYKTTYNSKTKVFCSWGCLRKYEKKHFKPIELKVE